MKQASKQRSDAVGDIWYRAEDECIDDGGEMYVGVEIIIVEFTVAKVTPSGVWLHCTTYPHRKNRFALSDGSRAVRRTKADAILSLIARKRRHIQIIEHQRRIALDAIEAAKLITT